MDTQPVAICWLTNPIDRDLVVLLLKRAGYQPELCQDQETIQRKIGESVVQLIIMDVVLPGQNGLEITRVIKSERPGNPPVVILVSSLAFADVVIQARQSGADDFIVKPIDSDQLYQRLTFWVKKTLSAAQPGT